MPKKTTKRRAWTTQHVNTLKSMAKKKMPAGRIAKTLKRTEGATRQKAFSMGLSLDSRL
jgi:NADH:ubiquinone oxidoreductase subunit